MTVIPFYSQEELDRLAAYRSAPLLQRKVMVQVYEAIERDTDDEEVRESCRRLTRAMGRESCQDILVYPLKKSCCQMQGI